MNTLETFNAAYAALAAGEITEDDFIKMLKELDYEEHEIRIVMRKIRRARPQTI
jgi:hypothetical protein